MWSPSLSPPARGTTYSCSVANGNLPSLCLLSGTTVYCGGTAPIPRCGLRPRNLRVPRAFGPCEPWAHGPPPHFGSGLRPRKAGCSTGLRPTCGDRVLDARQGLPTLRRNPIRLVGLVPPEIGIPRSCKAQAAHPECHGPVYAGVSASSVISALTSRPGHRNLKRRWIGLAQGGPRRRAWTAESCRCRTWGTGRRRGSPSRTGRR